MLPKSHNTFTSGQVNTGRYPPPAPVKPFRVCFSTLWGWHSSKRKP